MSAQPNKNEINTPARENVLYHIRHTQTSYAIKCIKMVLIVLITLETTMLFTKKRISKKIASMKNIWYVGMSDVTVWCRMWWLKIRGHWTFSFFSLEAELILGRLNLVMNDITVSYVFGQSNNQLILWYLELHQICRTWWKGHWKWKNWFLKSHMRTDLQQCFYYQDWTFSRS